MKEIHFYANSTPSDDAYYLHFADKQFNPAYAVVLKGPSWGKATVSASVKTPEYDVSFTIDRDHIFISRNCITLHLSQDLSPTLGRVERIIADFDVADDKYSEICRQRNEIQSLSTELFKSTSSPLTQPP